MKGAVGEEEEGSSGANGKGSGGGRGRVRGWRGKGAHGCPELTKDGGGDIAQVK